jgi:hypothetical protein
LGFGEKFTGDKVAEGLVGANGVDIALPSAKIHIYGGAFDVAVEFM